MNCVYIISFPAEWQGVERGDEKKGTNNRIRERETLSTAINNN